jgi:hypothetical protein
VNGNSLGLKSKDWIFVDNTRLNQADFHISSTYPFSDGVGYSKSKVPAVPFCLPLPIVDLGGCPQIFGETYKGILLGDVDGSYKNISPDGYIKALQTSVDTVVFDLANAIYTLNNIDVPVSIHSVNTVNGIDFATKFNEVKMQYDSVMDQTGYLDGYAYFNTLDRTLRYTATSSLGGPIQTGITLVLVRFHLLDGAINVSDFDSVRAYVNGNPANILFTSPTSGISDNVKDQNIEIYPVPASDKLNVLLSENSKIQMFDLNGKQVISETSVNADQKQVIDVRTIANGVYMMKVYNDRFVKIQKVVINK